MKPNLAFWNRILLESHSSYEHLMKELCAKIFLFFSIIPGSGGCILISSQGLPIHESVMKGCKDSPSVIFQKKGCFLNEGQSVSTYDVFNLSVTKINK